MINEHGLFLRPNNFYVDFRGEVIQVVSTENGFAYTSQKNPDLTPLRGYEDSLVANIVHPEVQARFMLKQLEQTAQQTPNVPSQPRCIGETPRLQELREEGTRELRESRGWIQSQQ